MIETIREVINPYRMFQNDGFMGLILSLIIILLIVGLIAFSIIITEPWWESSVFDLAYSERQTLFVKVVDKKSYTRTSTNYIQSGSILVPISSSSHHYVLTFKGEDFLEKIDNEDLFYETQQGDTGKLSYIVKFRKYKWESNDKFQETRRIKFKWNPDK